MRPHALRAALALAAALPTARATAQPAADSAAPRARVASLPLTPSRPLTFATESGTWLSVDVSPDGRTLAFDLLGDLYTLPIAGGAATRITDGLAFDAQPRWSPDGRRLVFVSDRDGADNVWTVAADGRDARQVTRLERTQFLSPAWTPDGKYIVVSRNASLFGSIYALYLYSPDGGTGVRMVGGAPPAGQGAAPAPAGPGGPAPTPNFVGAAFGADPRYVYAASRNGGAAGYNQTAFDWQVTVYDRETGQTSARTGAPGGAFKPVLTRDGRWLIYATREDTATSLRIRDLRSGDERWLRRNVQRDDMESRFSRDLMPNMAATPDSRALIATWGGKLWRVAIPTGEVTPIPFRADVDLRLGALSKFDYGVNDSTLTVSQVRNARPSPDGRRLAFTALDKLWVMDLPAGTPRRVTRTGAATGEHMPVWSPDGRWLAYVTWGDDGGHVQRVRADGAGQPERLTQQSAYYSDVNYTPDGRRLVAYRGPRQARQEEGFLFGRELVWLPSGGGATTVIAPVANGGFPHFTRADTARVYLTQGQQGLVSMRFDGTDRRNHLRVTGYVDVRQATPQPTPAGEILLSPEGDRALVQAGNNVYVVDAPLVGAQAPTVSVVNVAQAALPVRRLTRIGGDFAGWRPDGRGVHYSIGRSYFAYDLARADSLVRDSTARADSARAAGRPAPPADSAARAAARPAYEPQRVDVAITVPKDRPEGAVVLRNARLVTMRGATADEVIARGDVLVRGNRIAAVGPAGSLPVPAGAREIDVAGKTIVPGFVDTHAHLRPPFGVHKSQVWEYLANLAYGVTATRDPQTGTTDVLSYGDLVETGDILGPRIFSTGPGVFWSDDIRSLNDARDVLRRYTEFYRTNTIKQYMVGDRKVRQWVIMASRELGLTPTLEAGLDFRKNLTEAIDGYAGTEHSYPIAPLAEDVVQLVAKSGIVYTPTLLVLYGGPWAENYWYQRHDVTADAKLARFTPRHELTQRGLRRGGWWAESQYAHPLIAAQAKKIVDAGGRVGVGSHGQLQGLGYHWEMWSLASGGMTPIDVLRAATVHGADAIGLGRDLGTLDAGKLADLVVLDGDPLADIRNTNTVRYVMKNGRLYDGDTLAEVWPRARALDRPWWAAGEELPAAGGGGAPR
jgi:Tol biopolymer transport system component